MVSPALLLLADGRFPTGGHVHSAGVEQAVAVGDVGDVESLDRYLRARLATTGRVDASFAATACAVASESAADASSVTVRLAALDGEYTARTPSPYLRDVSRRFGRQLVRVAARTWPSAGLAIAAATPVGPHHSIALGVAAAAAGTVPGDAAVLAIHHLAGAVVTAGVRLIGLDPIELAAIQADAADAAACVLLDERPWNVDDLAELPATGGALTEILGEHHGGLDARLFVA